MDSECEGLATGVTLHVHRVFGDGHQGRTEWFLAAFQDILDKKLAWMKNWMGSESLREQKLVDGTDPKAIEAQRLQQWQNRDAVDIVHLSLGGPDSSDDRFVSMLERLNEAGIIVVSAAGNDGPVAGSIHNPADLEHVIAVGASDCSRHSVASFSSRGPVHWHTGSTSSSHIGRIKPDLVACSRLTATWSPSGCKAMSGTSTAAPQVTAALAMLLSAVPLSNRMSQDVHWPTFAMQLAHAASQPLASDPIGAQGSGLLFADSVLSHVLSNSLPVVTIFPSRIDWESAPFDASVLCMTCDPVSVHTLLLHHLTSPAFAVLSSQHVHQLQHLIGERTQPALPTVRWLDCTTGTSFAHTDADDSLAPLGFTLSLHRDRPRSFDPLSQFLHTATLAVTISARRPGFHCGRIDVEVWSVDRRVPHSVSLEFRAQVIDEHPSVLLDVSLSAAFPRNRFIPGDHFALPVDWIGDSPHTNLHSLATQLGSISLNQPLLCLDPTKFSHLWIVDPELPIDPLTLLYLRQLVLQGRLSIAAFAEWSQSVDGIQILDDATETLMPALTSGGSDAIQQLIAILFADEDDVASILTHYGPVQSLLSLDDAPSLDVNSIRAVLGERVWTGSFPLSDNVGDNVERPVPVLTSSSITRWPGSRRFVDLHEVQLSLSSPTHSLIDDERQSVAIYASHEFESGSRLFVMSDSACIDEAQLVARSSSADSVQFCDHLVSAVSDLLNGNQVTLFDTAFVSTSPPSGEGETRDPRTQWTSNRLAKLSAELATRSVNCIDQAELMLAGSLPKLWNLAKAQLIDSAQKFELQQDAIDTLTESQISTSLWDRWSWLQIGFVVASIAAVAWGCSLWRWQKSLEAELKIQRRRVKGTSVILLQRAAATESR